MLRASRSSLQLTTQQPSVDRAAVFSGTRTKEMVDRVGGGGRVGRLVGEFQGVLGLAESFQENLGSQEILGKFLGRSTGNSGILRHRTGGILGFCVIRGYCSRSHQSQQAKGVM